MDYEKNLRLSEQIISLLDGETYALQLVAEKLGLGVVTKYHAIKRDKLLCDPIIWMEGDLEHCSLDEWNATRAFKILRDRSIEEGQQIRAELEYWMANSEE